ncbi:uncharacterized protein BKA55DRAFT_271473 [Fusarium redolens]|uniref:Zn(2)-C6 fungal-type domain-containing protein n=1 Tax=Fusarium redolens TaxID=48865 RepID=A0A9P9HNS6_FUSRE|nr:uncharacterized protein BKA55DRAFT_271473 [Fusarium redolens]KAH7260900.1 hypothetical protein BKA55DRAFT_271473 [Fusarium redolens]
MTSSTMASRFRGDGKASLSCTRCINRKQTCDRVLPTCSRCASLMQLSAADRAISFVSSTRQLASAVHEAFPQVRLLRLGI